MVRPRRQYLVAASVESAPALRGIMHAGTKLTSVQASDYFLRHYLLGEGERLQNELSSISMTSSKFVVLAAGSLVAIIHSTFSKREQSHAMLSPPSYSNPNSSSDRLSNSLNSEWVRKLVLITYLLLSSPTYTARHPCGMSWGSLPNLDDLDIPPALPVSRAHCADSGSCENATLLE
ncbi:hypothetical protein Mapa_005972 [Marchantia paleacea]|nr:hypothetical protein Mapa_005972 [Marchantia paleacea]